MGKGKDSESTKSGKSGGGSGGGGGGGGGDIGASRETWCAVECKKEQDWCRTERKHYGIHLKSSVFTSQGPPPKAESGAFDPEKPKQRERRHYDEYNESQINI